MQQRAKIAINSNLQLHIHNAVCCRLVRWWTVVVTDYWLGGVKTRGGAIDYTSSSYIPTILCSVDTFMLIRFTLSGPFVASLRGETYQVTIYNSTEDKVVATDD